MELTSTNTKQKVVEFDTVGEILRTVQFGNSTIPYFQNDVIKQIDSKLEFCLEITRKL